MTWLGLALRNCGRRRLRSALTALGIAAATGLLFNLLAFQRGYTRGLAAELDRLGAHILVVPKGCPYEAASIAIHGARWPCYLKAEILDELRALDTLATAAPVFMSAVYDAEDRATVYCGVTRDILALKRDWSWEGRFPAAPDELLVGAALAERNGWRVADRVFLPGLDGRRSRIAGILRPTGGPDDEFIYMRLAEAQRLFQRPGALTHVLARLRDPEQLDRAVAEMRSCGAAGEMNVVPLSHLFRTVRAMLGSTRWLLGAVVLVTLWIAAAAVANTMLMAVVERTAEIGTLRALGASTVDLFRLFWLEGLLLSAAGGALGLLFAFGGAREVEAWLRTRILFAPDAPLLRWEWELAAACWGAAVLLGGLAALLPARRAAGMPPIEAIRSEGAAP